MDDKKTIVIIGGSGEVANILLESTDIRYYKIISTTSKKNLDNFKYCDLESQSSIDDFLYFIKKEKINTLILNASITPKYFAKNTRLDLSYINKFFLVNCSSYIYLIEKIHELKINIKNIVIISSLSAYFSSKKHISYNSSKAAQLSIYNSFKIKYNKISWYIFLLSSGTNNKLDYRKISKEYKKILNNSYFNKSKVINFSKKKSFIYFFKKFFHIKA